MSLPSHQLNQLADHCYLMRKKHQLNMDIAEINKHQQEIYKLEENLRTNIRIYENDQREYWTKYEKIKKFAPIKSSREVIKDSNKQIQKILKDFNMSAAELSALVGVE